MSQSVGKPDVYKDLDRIESDVRRVQDTLRTMVVGGGGDVTQAELDDHISATGKGAHVPAGGLPVADLAFDPATQAELDAHKTSGDHDGRYYTETEINTLLGGKIDKTIFDAKGDLIVGSGADAAIRVALSGVNGRVLMEDSTASAGVKWAAPTAGAAAYDTRKVGEAFAWTSNTIPDDCVLAAGQTLNESDYQQLCAHAAAEVAAGNALWTISGVAPFRSFTVPDLQNRFIYGKGAKALGTKGGLESVKLTGPESGTNSNGKTNNTGGHWHNPGWGGNFLSNNGPGGANITLGGGGYAGVPTTDTQGAHEHTLIGRDADTAHENMPPYVVLAWVIKAKGVEIISPTVIQGPPGTDGAPSSVVIEPWKTVGADGGATSYAAGWVVHSASYKVQYRKRPDGAVEIRGLAKASAATAAHSIVFTLPPAYRPPNAAAGGSNEQFFGCAWGNAAAINPASVAIDSTTGAVRCSRAMAIDEWLSIDLQFATSQDRFPAGSLTSKRVKGLVTSGGAVAGGIGFSVTKNATGDYTIVFNPAFTARPVFIPMLSSAGATIREHPSSPANASSIRVQTLNDAGVAVDASFHFVAEDVGLGLETVMDVEPWHVINNPGEPIFKNSWVNWGGPPNPAAAFKKTPDGSVHLKGRIKNGNSGAVAFTLPPSYCPTEDRRIPGSPNLVYIQTNGDVSIWGASSPITETNIDVIFQP